MNSDRYVGWQRFILGVTYVLHILLLPAVVGALINAFKIREYAKAAGADNGQRREAARFFESHHRWLLHTFLISLFFLAAGYGTAYWAIGYAVGIGAAVWWIYRMIRGVVAYVANKPMPVWDDMSSSNPRGSLASH